MSHGGEDQAGLDRVRPYQRGSALYCFIAAAGVGGLARDGLLARHDLAQLTPFLIHLALNGFFLWFIADLSVGSGWLSRSVMVRAGSFLVATGLGAVGLFLAGQAIIDFTSANAPALLLIVPGVAGFLPTLAGDEERGIGAEVLNEVPRIPFRPLSASFGGSVAKQAIGWTAAIAGCFLLFEWYFILKQVLWSGARYDLIHVAVDNIRAALQGWPAIIPLLFIGLVVALSSWGPLLREAFEGFKEQFGFAGLTPGQRAIVQERLQRLWDYANAPEWEKGSIAVLLLPVIPTVALIALAFWLLANSDGLAGWLFPPPTSHPAGVWSLVVRDSALLIWPVMLLFPVAWSLHRLCTDHWPRALQQAIVSDLQQGPTLNACKVRALRRAISREVKQGPDRNAFSPGDYLLERRRRSSRGLHLVSGAALLLALLLGWRGLATYTRVTEAGFEDPGFLTGREFFYNYSDVVSVKPQCFLGHNRRVAYQVEFRDGRHADLLFEKDLAANLSALKQIDQRLRRSRARFEPLADNPKGIQNARECVQALGKEYGDSQGFAQIMHLDLGAK